ncbi:O-antigen ligase family protein [Pedobacter mendelii]
MPFVLILLMGTLFTLKCRSALLGASTGIFIILNYKYQLYSWAKDKKNRILLILTAFIVISISFPLGIYTYQAKEASADGRRLIWKVSAQMISDKPLFGYGYGAFERNYNLFQSRYFEKGDAKPNEILNAGFVKMAYNEFLQNTIEGGIIGGVLFMCLLASLLYFPLKNKSIKIQHLKKRDANYSITAYAGICIFITMSMLNFTIQALPVMFLFIIFSSILSANSPAISLRKGLSTWNKLISEKNKNRYVLTYRLSLFVIGLCYMYMTGNLIIDNLKNKQAALLTKNRDYEQSLNILTSLQNRLDIYESYWVNYANTLFLNKDYKHAAIIFKKAKLLTSNPMIYLQAALCDEKTGDYKSAYKNLTTAKNMEPGHLAAKFALMNLSLKMGDTIGCVNQAQNIIETVPKIRSSETIFFKSRAGLLLQQLGYSSKKKSIKAFPENNKFYLPKKNI